MKHTHFIFLKNVFMAVLGLRCCAGFFSSCSMQGLLSLRCSGFSLVASLVAEHGL